MILFKTNWEIFEKSFPLTVTRKHAGGVDFSGTIDTGVGSQDNDKAGVMHCYIGYLPIQFTKK